MSGIFGPSPFAYEPPGTDLWKKYREIILFRYIFGGRKRSRQEIPRQRRPTIGELIYHRTKARWGST